MWNIVWLAKKINNLVQNSTHQSKALICYTTLKTCGAKIDTEDQPQNEGELKKYDK